MGNTNSINNNNKRRCSIFNNNNSENRENISDNYDLYYETDDDTDHEPDEYICFGSHHSKYKIKKNEKGYPI